MHEAKTQKLIRTSPLNRRAAKISATWYINNDLINLAKGCPNQIVGGEYLIIIYEIKEKNIDFG